MEFDIDVSGEDIFSKGYTITVANQNSIIYSYRFDIDIVRTLLRNFEDGYYRYKKSKRNKSLFKVRLYCTVIYYLFRRIKKSEKIEDNFILNVCRDFDGHENNINTNLKVFLQNLLGLKIEKINHHRLGGESVAHHYSYLVRKDVKNQFPNVIKLSLGDFEKFLKKK